MTTDAGSPIHTRSFTKFPGDCDSHLEGPREVLVFLGEAENLGDRLYRPPVDLSQRCVYPFPAAVARKKSKGDNISPSKRGLNPPILKTFSGTKPFINFCCATVEIAYLPVIAIASTPRVAWCPDSNRPTLESDDETVIFLVPKWRRRIRAFVVENLERRRVG
jgi:hypothetical protein